jgi:hypothetical protein
VYFYHIFKFLIMKTKDILIIGAGATIVYLLWKRSKKNNSLESLTGGNGTSGNVTTGGNAMPLQSEPEQVYGLNLPAGMDLPVLTAGTGVPTEVAVQNGGVLTTPTPALVTTPAMDSNEALGGLLNVIPKEFPKLSPCEQKWVEYSALIRVPSQEAYDIMKAKFMAECQGTSSPIVPVKNPKLEVADVVSTPIYAPKQSDLASLSFNGAKPNYIKGQLYRGVM